MSNKIKDRYNIKAPMSSLNNYRKRLNVVSQTNKNKESGVFGGLFAKQASKQASKQLI